MKEDMILCHNKTRSGKSADPDTENYMTDPDMTARLSKEAFQRSLERYTCSSYFYFFRNATGVIDTVAAQKKRDEVLQRLQKGEDFLQVAQQNSDDPSAKNNKGDLGYITVFTLPYEFENVVYNYSCW